jgi:glycosyltransferase involved in cell wall biosynthesis
VAKEMQVLFVGQFNEEKNPLVFARAAAIVAASNAKVRFVALGKGPLEGKLRQFAYDAGLDDRFEIRHVADPIPEMARSLIAVSLQRTDNYHSQALMECMACGCAIIASDKGETGRLVTEQVGFRVEIGERQIADKILWLLANRGTAENMGRAARRLVMEQESLERYGGYQVDLYREACRRANEEFLERA